MLALTSICLYKKLTEQLSLVVGSIAAAISVRNIGNKISINKVDILKTLEHLLK